LPMIINGPKDPLAAHLLHACEACPNRPALHLSRAARQRLPAIRYREQDSKPKG
jgi:hypothetical protein